MEAQLLWYNIVIVFIIQQKRHLFSHHAARK